MIIFAADMIQQAKKITRTLSVRLSFMVVGAIAVLLAVALFILFHYSRKAVKEESLQKAAQTLEGTVQHIDNILLSVEQAAGNTFFNILPNLNRKDLMFTYSRELVASNPWIEGCAIAFKPNFYKDSELFMAYVHRAHADTTNTGHSSLIESETFANSPYTEQRWFSEPIATGVPVWMTHVVDDDADIAPITTFCLPIPGLDGKPVAVIGVDVSLSLLSRIVLAAKPSPNSYSTLVDRDGSFIVHPDSNLLLYHTVFTEAERRGEPTVKAAANAMMSGEQGYMSFRSKGTNYYIFYKPFKRATVPGRITQELGWSAGIIYPEDDIFGAYNRLLYYVLAIAAVGLILLFILVRIITHRQLLPLRMLSKSAQRIADGHYDEPIPDSRQQNEIGRLQNHFQQMQQSLSAHVKELEQLTATLNERGEGLQQAYAKTKEGDRLKTAFLHNMTNQMVDPSDSIISTVNALCKDSGQATQEDLDRYVENINSQGKAITELLNNLLDLSQEKIKQ